MWINGHSLVNTVLGGKRFLHNHWYFHFHKGQRNYSVAFGDTSSFLKDFNYYCCWEGWWPLLDAFVRMIDEQRQRKQTPNFLFPWNVRLSHSLAVTLRMSLGTGKKAHWSSSSELKQTHKRVCAREQSTTPTRTLLLAEHVASAFSKAQQKGRDSNPETRRKPQEQLHVNPWSSWLPFLALIVELDIREIHLYHSFRFDEKYYRYLNATLCFIFQLCPGSICWYWIATKRMLDDWGARTKELQKPVSLIPSASLRAIKHQLHPFALGLWVTSRDRGESKTRSQPGGTWGDGDVYCISGVQSFACLT